jgi:ribosomal protein L37AE/L43A
MYRVNRRTAAADMDVNRPTAETCLACNNKGGVIVARVKRRLLVQLQWRCRDCGEMWTGPERRSAVSSVAVGF